MTDGEFYFVMSELLLCGAYTLYKEILQEMEDYKLPPGCYRLSWGGS